jgi:AraC-like DNA-binding protein
MTQRASTRQGQSILRRSLGKHVELDVIAAQLRMTAVTLRRRLAEEGGQRTPTCGTPCDAKSHSKLVRDPHAKLEDVASRLGFASTAPSIAAFRRWTGMVAYRVSRAIPCQELAGALTKTSWRLSF